MTMNLQEKTEQLYNSISSMISHGNFPHGVLIECQSSAEGEALAKHIASSLVCSGNIKPCGVCSDCVKSQSSGHPDIFETDGIRGKSKSFTVDAVREIRDDAFVVPNESDKKIYILKNAHNMNEQAQNAILKILEEPPSYVYFIIVTESRSMMLETVLSRVQIFSLVSEDNQLTEKETQAVRNMVTALLNVNELALMEQTAVFVKNNQFAKTVITLLSEVFRDALVKKSGFQRESSFPEETNKLYSGLTAKSLMQLIEACNGLIESIDRNCNNNLLLVRICSEFKRAIGR